MKKRLKNWITSILGILIMLASSTMFFFGEKLIEEFEMSMTEYITLLFVGWVFLAAKDSLIEGIFCNILKLKK